MGGVERFDRRLASEREGARLGDRGGTFSQGLEVSRPHTLLTANPKWSGQLLYRYDDTGDQVTVPNAWWNQTTEMRAEYWRYQACRLHEMASRLEAEQPYWMKPDEIKLAVARYRSEAKALAEKAELMMSLDRAGYPALGQHLAEAKSPQQA